MHSELTPYISSKDHDFTRVDTDLGVMKSLFSRELTPELADQYIDSLKDRIGSYDSYDDFVQKGKEVHRALGRDIYGPVIVGFLQWTEQKLRENGINHGPVHFALRDSWPFYAAAHVLWDGSNSYHAVGTYINRPLLSIEDEIAPEKAEVNGFVREYLAKSGIVDTGSPVAIIDSGAWGTVIRSLKETYLPHTLLYPLFWYSHNPSISGFTNDMLKQVKLPQEFGEILNDSLECMFPQHYRRPISFISDGGTRVLSLAPSDPLSVAWGEAALEGVVEAAHQYKSGIASEQLIDAVQQLYVLSEYARMSGEWTGVLPTHTPTWSKGKEFLTAWPETLLP